MSHALLLSHSQIEIRLFLSKPSSFFSTGSSVFGGVARGTHGTEYMMSTKGKRGYTPLGSGDRGMLSEVILHA